MSIWKWGVFSPIPEKLTFKRYHVLTWQQLYVNKHFVYGFVFYIISILHFHFFLSTFMHILLLLCVLIPCFGLSLTGMGPIICVSDSRTELIRREHHTTQHSHGLRALNLWGGRTKGEGGSRALLKMLPTSDETLPQVCLNVRLQAEKSHRGSGCSHRGERMRIHWNIDVFPQRPG